MPSSSRWSPFRRLAASKARQTRKEFQISAKSLPSSAGRIVHDRPPGQRAEDPTDESDSRLHHSIASHSHT